jgi:hypothetical protein
MATILPAVAPHESCVACFKGDTTTGLALRGSDEFKAAGLAAMGIPVEQAISTIEANAPHDPVSFIRVCADCAARARLKVTPLRRGGEMPVYTESE